MSALEEYKVRKVGGGCDDDEEDTDVLHKQCKSCKECPVCCYQILKRYNLFTDAYHILGWGYRYLLTLPVTQVACERSFSVLKHIKSRIRSTQSQEHLEASMLMTTEKDILMSLDNDLVIDKVAEKSDLLKKILIPQH